MKTLLALLLLTINASAQVLLSGNSSVSGNALLSAGIPGGGGGGESLTQGDIFNESFEGAGSENVWTVNAAGINLDYSLPGSPPSPLGSQGARCNFSGTAINSYYDLGGAVTATRYFRCFVYIASHSLNSTDKHVLFCCTETTDVNIFPRFYLYLVNSGGTLQLYSSSLTSSTAQNITTGNWYRVEIMSVNNNTTSVFRLYDSAGTQIGSDSTFQTGNYYFRYLFVGRTLGDNVNAVDFTVDGIGVSSSGYLGL